MSRRDEICAGDEQAPPEPEGQQADRLALRPCTLKTKDQRDDCDQRIGKRLQDLGQKPFRPRAPGDDRPPHPQNRWVFPSIAYPRGGKLSTEFVKSVKGKDTKNFCLVTLRFGDAKPEPGRLAEHIEGLSKAFNSVVSYLCRTGIAKPQLSAIHVRYDKVSGRLDPHLQGIWDISPELMSRAKKLLHKYFSGVWIDKEKIRSLNDASHYICVGIYDHEAVPDWPNSSLLESWRPPPAPPLRPPSRGLR